MLHVKLYVASALLVLSSVWHQCLTLPVSSPLTKEPMTDNCGFHAQAVLDNITDALTEDNKKNLFNGINCIKQSVELNTNTHTPSVCAPQGTTCSGVSKSQFNEELCLQNIGEDLRYYYKLLAVHPDPDRFLNNNVLLRLRELMTNCFSWTLKPEDLKETSSDNVSSYEERLSLCKELKGFQVRAITINRAIGYMKSGEHRK